MYKMVWSPQVRDHTCSMSSNWRDGNARKEVPLGYNAADRNFLRRHQLFITEIRGMEEGIIGLEVEIGSDNVILFDSEQKFK